MKIELYNLDDDLVESNDVSGQNPNIITQIESIIKKEHIPGQTNKFKIKELGDKCSNLGSFAYRLL